MPSLGWWFWDLLKKQAEQAMSSKPVGSLFVYISACLQVSALFEFLPSLLLMMNCCMKLSEINPFLPKLLLVMVLCHYNSNPNKDSLHLKLSVEFHIKLVKKAKQTKS